MPGPVTEPDLVDEPESPLAAVRAALVGEHPGDLGVGNELEKGLEVEELEDESDRLVAEGREAAVAHSPDVGTIDDDATLGRLVEATHELEQRRLSTTTRADQGHELALVDRQGHAVEGLDPLPADGVRLAEVGHLDDDPARARSCRFRWARSGRGVCRPLAFRGDGTLAQGGDSGIDVSIEGGEHAGDGLIARGRMIGHGGNPLLGPVGRTLLHNA